MHIGLTIKNEAEIKNFYQNLLGFKLKREFTLPKELNQKIFGFYEDTSVFRLSNNNFELELFATNLPARKNYTHISFEVEDRKTLIQKAKERNYPPIIVEREEKPDLVFLQDQFGNLFEIIEEDK